MLEFAALIVFLMVGAVVLAVLAVAGFLLKLLFKVLLIPLALAGWLFKAALALVGGLLLLIVLGPAVLVIGLVVVLPLLLLAGLVWGAVSVLSAA